MPDARIIADTGPLVALLDDRTALSKLVRKYEDAPMSLADACVVRMAELFPKTVVFTADKARNSIAQR